MKEKSRFLIFNSHLDLAHQYWKKVLQNSDWAIDATCGNGHDTLYLAQIAEGVIGLDIQKKALENTRLLLQKHFIADDKVLLFLQSHEAFPPIEKPIRLVVYNLGYLPGGGNKNFTTQSSSTLISIQQALKIVLPGGAVSITCYPGHQEGAIEESSILDFCKKLSPKEWSVCFHNWENREKAPSLLFIQKIIC